MKKKRWLILSIIFIILLLGGLFSFFFYQKKVEEVKRKEQAKKEEKRITTIREHYATRVVTNGCDIYRKEKGKYQKIGHVSKEEILTLIKPDQFIEPYFQVQDFNFYVPSSCVKPSSKEKSMDTRYQKYVPFAEKMKTKESVRLYRNNQLVYEIFYSLELPIIKKSDTSYYGEYFGELFEIKKEDVSEVIKTKEESTFTTELPVTAYHFIYPPDDYGCTGVICHPVSQIRSHFEYLTKNNYFTITTTEMEEFLDQQIRLPEKSILITIDDGDRVENILPLLEEFKVNATVFLISAWYSAENYPSSYLETASHTHELHEPGKCAGGQGSALKCLDKEKIVADLRQSRAALHNTTAFCYPLYEYNDHALAAVKEAGFHLGFIGGQRKAKITSSKLLIPRITIHRDTTMEEYIRYIR